MAWRDPYYFKEQRIRALNRRFRGVSTAQEPRDWRGQIIPALAGVALGVAIFLVVTNDEKVSAGLSAARSFVLAPATCDQARAAGIAPMARGAPPGYAAHLDADDDGIACEPYPRGY